MAATRNLLLVVLVGVACLASIPSVDALSEGPRSDEGHREGGLARAEALISLGELEHRAVQGCQENGDPPCYNVEVQANQFVITGCGAPTSIIRRTQALTRWVGHPAGDFYTYNGCLYAPLSGGGFATIC